MADTKNKLRITAGRSIFPASRSLRLAAALVLLAVTHPSVGLGGEKERGSDIATENAPVAGARMPDIGRALRGLTELAPEDLQNDANASSGRWSRAKLDAWREKHESARESSAASDGGTPATSPPARRNPLPKTAIASAPNPVDVAPLHATRPQTRPARSLRATGSADSLAWLRSPPPALWLIWLPWLLVPASLLSAIYILIRTIPLWAARSGQSAPTVTAAGSQPMRAPEVESLQPTPVRQDRGASDRGRRSVYPVAAHLLEVGDPTQRPTRRVIVDFPPPQGVPDPDPPARDYQVLTIANNKGGVGKTTLAVNLAVYIRALRDDLPVLLISFDDQSLPDRMFALDSDPPGATVVGGMLEGSFASTIRMGEYGVEYVPSDPEVGALKRHVQSPLQLRSVLDRTGYTGLVIVDTKSDLEILTQNAIEASDLTIVPVADQESLFESEKVYELLDRWQRPHERARIALTLIDLRVRYRGGSHHDMLSLLVSEIRERGFPLFETFVSRSPKVQSLHTNPSGRIPPILHGAPASLIHRQMGQLTEEILASLDAVAMAVPRRSASEFREASNMGRTR